MECQIVAMDSINSWHPHKAAPAEIESCMVYNDVNGVIITSFPPEELGDVDQLKDNID
jgi:hypothetical protein